MDLEAIRYDLQDAKPRFKRYALARDYWAGRHRYPFASPRFAEMYRWLLQTAQMNVCPTIVDAFTDRIDMDNWGIDKDDPLTGQLDRLRSLADREAWRCGDAFAVVWPGADGTPRPWYHRADQILPHVDEADPGKLAWAAKLWTQRDGRGRLTVYGPEAAERWITDQRMVDPGMSATLDDWERALDHLVPFTGDGDPAVIGHTMGDVPVLWWRHDADEQAGFGHSILRDVVPIQDELNYAVAASIIGVERMAEPIRYALADEPPKRRLNPATGQLESPTVDFDPTRENLLTLVAKSAGQFPTPPAADLQALQSNAARKAGSVVGVPAWYLAEDSDGQAPSGESLRVELSRMLSAITAYEVESSPVNRGLMRLLGRDDAQPVYADPMPQSRAEQLAEAQIKAQLGYSLSDIATFLGETDVDGIVQRAQQASAESARAAGRALMNGTIGYDS